MTTQMVEAANDPARSVAGASLCPAVDMPGLTLDALPTSGFRTVVFVGGELDISTAGHVYDFVRQIIDRPSTEVVLDLSAVRFCDASGLNSLVKIKNRADLAGCQIVLAEPTPLVARVLRLGRLHERFATVSTQGVPGSDGTPVPAATAA